jgi:hypothetical protein
LDVGWHPEFESDGHFRVRAILDNDWIKHLSEMKCTKLSELSECIDRTSLFINEMKKIKDIPYRDVTYEKFD